MNDVEIKALKDRVQLGDVWWNDGDGWCKRVLLINLEWIEFPYQENPIAEPAAILTGGGTIALYNVDADSFVMMLPCIPDSRDPKIEEPVFYRYPFTSPSGQKALLEASVTTGRVNISIERGGALAACASVKRVEIPTLVAALLDAQDAIDAEPRIGHIKRPVLPQR